MYMCKCEHDYSLIHSIVSVLPLDMDRGRTDNAVYIHVYTHTHIYTLHSARGAQPCVFSCLRTMCWS